MQVRCLCCREHFDYDGTGCPHHCPDCCHCCVFEPEYDQDDADDERYKFAREEGVR